MLRGGNNAEGVGKTAFYRYNKLNQLVSYESEDAKASYAYNADGLRESKTVDGSTTRYYYYGSLVINESVNGSQTATNLLGQNSIIGRKAGSDVGYFVKNGHGDVTKVIGPDGTEKASYENDVWGGATGETGSFDNPVRYAGEYYDAESGNIYLRARYYDPTLGRFASEDPIKDGGNWYVYCYNNPIALVDPLGLAARYVNSQTSLNMRSGAGTSYSVINSISRGTMVDYTGNKTKEMIDGHYWAEVTYNGTTGWVAATYLGIDPIGGKTTNVEPFGAIYGIYYETTWVGPYVVSNMNNKDDVIILDFFTVAATSPAAAEELKALEASEREFVMSVSMMSGGLISGYTKHGLAQAIGRDGGRGVNPNAILDAVKNPQKIVNQAGETIKYIGENATVVLNKVGEVVTTWARNSLGVRW